MGRQPVRQAVSPIRRSSPRCTPVVKGKDSREAIDRFLADPIDWYTANANPLH